MPAIQLIGPIVPRASSGTRRNGTGSHPRWRNSTAPIRALVLRSASESSGVAGAGADGVGSLADMDHDEGLVRLESRKLAGAPSLLKRARARARRAQWYRSAPRNSLAT